MGTKKQKQELAPITETKIPKTFIGIDFHKRYSVYHVLDEAGKDVAKGRIDHATPDEFGNLVKRFPGCRVAFEASMNCLRPCKQRFAFWRGRSRVTRWYWLFEILELQMSAEDIVLANPFKTRIIAEAQVKTDKVDARILALLLELGVSVRILTIDSGKTNCETAKWHEASESNRR